MILKCCLDHEAEAQGVILQIEMAHQLFRADFSSAKLGCCLSCGYGGTVVQMASAPKDTKES